MPVHTIIIIANINIKINKLFVNYRLLELVRIVAGEWVMVNGVHVAVSLLWVVGIGVHREYWPKNDRLCCGQIVVIVGCDGWQICVVPRDWYTAGVC